MRRALWVPSHPLAVAWAPRALLTEPIAGSPFPRNSGQALWCLSWFASLLLSLQKLEDDWACVSQTHANLSAATFHIWCLSLKCSGLLHIRILAPTKLLFLQSFLPSSRTSPMPNWIERPPAESGPLTQSFLLLLIARDTTLSPALASNIMGMQHLLIHLLLISCIQSTSPVKYALCPPIPSLYLSMSSAESASTQKWNDMIRKLWAKRWCVAIPYSRVCRIPQNPYTLY